MTNRELTDKEFLDVIKRFAHRDDMTTNWLIEKAEKAEKYEKALKEINHELKNILNDNYDGALSEIECIVDKVLED